MKKLKSTYEHNPTRKQVAIYISFDRPSDLEEALNLILVDVIKQTRPIQGIHIYPRFTKEVIRNYEA